MVKKIFNKFLNLILILSVSAFIALIVFWGYETYRKYDIETEGKKAIEEFEQEISEDIVYVELSEDEEIQEDIIEEKEQKETSKTTTSKTTTKSSTKTTTSISNTKSNNKQSSVQEEKTVKKKMYRGFVMAGYIQIPITKVKIPIVESVVPKALEKSVGILIGPGLNKPGNTVIVGHNYRNGTLFSKNSRIDIGDVIYITDKTGETLIYTVYNKYITTPDDSEYINRETENNIELSLSTCTDDNSRKNNNLGKSNVKL